MPILFRDYETRSTIELKKAGAYVYASAPLTDVWCCAYAVVDGPINLWTPGMETPAEIIEAARNPDWLVSAFNDSFERQIEEFIMAPRFGWPTVPIERHRCSQAAALALALPANLANAASALGVDQQKDAEGHRVMLQMSKPRPPRAGEDLNGIYWFDDPARREKLYAYCKQDVATERALHKRIGFLPAAEQTIWELDAAINDRGLYLDGTLLDGALGIADEQEAEIAHELAGLTAGRVTSIHQKERLIAWLEEHGCRVADVRKPTLQKVLTNGVAPEVRRVMELRLAGAHAAASKLVTMRNWRGADGRVRGALKYHGAATGRWASWGVQVHNLKRPTTKDLGAAISAVSTGSLQLVKAFFPDPMSVVGDLGRAIVCAAPGNRLLAADFSGVESRIGAYLSGQQSKADQWARFDATGDPRDEPYYLLGKKFGLPEETARDKGKIADLAFQYMGSVGAYRALDPNTQLTDEEIQDLKQRWRDEHPHTVRFWKALDRSAVRAIQAPGVTIPCGRVSLTYDGTFLRMRLPSGRDLAYPFPRLHTNERGDCVVIFKDNAKGKFLDCRNGQGAYGGTWIENAVQATARDLFVEALIRLEAAGYPVVLHVHDEIVCEAPIGVGTLEEFHKIMIAAPAWAEGLPIAAKARNGARFAKNDSANAPPRAAEPAPARQSDTNSTPEPEILQQNEQTPPWEPDKETLMQPPLNPEPGETPKHIEAAPPIVPAAPAEVAAPAMPVRRFNGYPHGEEEPAGQKSVAEFLYRNAEQAPHQKVLKFEWFKDRKREMSFPQRWPVNGCWVSKQPANWVPIPYRLPELLAAPADAVVDIFEGEKDADRGAALGLIATTNPGGAKKWRAELNEYFRERRVRIHEDHDDAGSAHIAKVAAALKDIAKEITVVRYPEVPPGEDFSWFMDHGGTLEAMAARAKPYATKFKFNLVCAADVVPRKLDWLWRGHLLRGALELSAGQPGLGKSQAQCSFTAYATKGAVWPDGAPGCPPGYVIMLTAEDCLDQILVPRLIAAGAIRERVLILKSIRMDEKDGRAFLLSEDIEALEQLLIERPDVRLVTLDPITAYMGGKLDSHRTTDVRHQLGPLVGVAERTNVAFSAITHPPKNAGPSAMNHYIGSQAFIAAARIGHLFVEEMEANEYGKHMPTGRRLFTNPKNNPHPPMPTLAYRVEGADGGKNHDGETIATSRVVWGEVVEITADEAIAAAAPKKDKDKDGAKPFLLDMLANGPVPKSVIDERAAARGFSSDQLRRARESMAVVTFKDGFHGGWVWCLPQHAPKDAKPGA